MACDTDLAIVMNIAVAHVAAGPDADPGPAVPAQLAVLDRPSAALGRLDRAFLRNARIFLDRYVPDQDVARHALERKSGDGGFNLAVRRIVGEIDLAAGIIEIESVALETVLAQDPTQRLVVDEHAFRPIACRRGARTLAVLAAALHLAAHHPIVLLSTKVREQPAAVKDRATLAVKPLARAWPNHLQPMNAVLQAKRCAFAGAIDRSLDGSAGFDRDRPRRTSSISDARGDRRRITEDQ